MRHRSLQRGGASVYAERALDVLVSEVPEITRARFDHRGINLVHPAGTTYLGAGRMVVAIYFANLDLIIVRPES